MGQAPFALATSNALRLRAMDLRPEHPPLRHGSVYSCCPVIARPRWCGMRRAVALSEKRQIKSGRLVLSSMWAPTLKFLLGTAEKVLALFPPPRGPAFEARADQQRANASRTRRDSNGVEIDPVTKILPVQVIAATCGLMIPPSRPKIGGQWRHRHLVCSGNH